MLKEQAVECTTKYIVYKLISLYYEKCTNVWYFFIFYDLCKGIYFEILILVIIISRDPVIFCILKVCEFFHRVFVFFKFYWLYKTLKYYFLKPIYA